MGDSGGKAELASELMSAVDPELLEFLLTQVNTFVKWDLVRFFHANPHTTDTAENIARYTGRDPVVVTSDLDALVQGGVLHAGHLAGLTIYTLTPDPEMRSLMSRFLQASEDRRFRVKAIFHVLRGMR